MLKSYTGKCVPFVHRRQKCKGGVICGMEISVDGELKRICEAIKKIAAPSLLVVFSPKFDTNGKLCDFDAAVVADPADGKKEAVRRIYRGIDSEIPFDVFLYTSREWEELTARPSSFASRALRKGKIVYGAENRE